MSNGRGFLFGGPGESSRWSDIGLTFLRLYAGLALALSHGLGKVPPSEGFIGMIGEAGFPVPVVFAWFVMIAEFIGGLLLALGLMTRLAALFIVVEMFGVAIIWHMLIQGDPFGAMELPLFFFFAALVFLIRGSGRYSLDAMIRRERAIEQV